MRSPSGRERAAEALVDRLDPVMADLVRATGASVALLYLLPPGKQVLQLVLLSGASEEMAAPWTRVPVDAPIPVVDAIRQRRLVWLGGQEEMARRYPRLGFVLPYDFLLGAAPLVGGKVWGGIVLLWPVRHAPRIGARERDVLTAHCDRVVAVCEQAEREGRRLDCPPTPRKLAVPRPPADPGEAVAALGYTERLPTGCCSLDLDGRVEYLNPAATGLLDAGAASLMGERPWDVLPWLSDLEFEERYRAALISRRPTSFTAVRPPGTPLRFDLYPGDSGISVDIAPTGAAADAGPADRHLSGPVRATSLYLLTHLAAVLSEAAGVQDVAERVADQVVPAFGPQGLVLMTMEEGRLHVVEFRGYSTDFIDHFDGTPVTSDAPAARAFTTGAPAFFSSFAEYQGAYPGAPRHLDRNSWAFLPLTASSRHIGSLMLSYDQGRHFSPAERAVLTSLAGLIAQALDRARLFDAKHALARTLQTGLLPQRLPRVEGLEVAARYRSAGYGMDVGGDFYDLIHSDPAAAVAAIGDVQGHDPRAAALMGQIRTAVHAHATLGTSPDAIVAGTNGLVADLDQDLFASCLIVHADVTRHRARLSNAGHLPPLLRHPDGRTEVLRLPPGMLLGIDPHATYFTTEVPLPPGSVLALYTDGLVETPGTDIDDAIQDMALHLGRADGESMDDLADDLVHHATGDTGRHDDIALLLLRPTS